MRRRIIINNRNYRSGKSVVAATITPIDGGAKGYSAEGGNRSAFGHSIEEACDNLAAAFNG